MGIKLDTIIALFSLDMSNWEEEVIFLAPKVHYLKLF